MSAKLTTVIVMFWDLQIFYHMFLLQKVKRNEIITNKKGKFELVDELPNEGRLKKISKILRIIN